MKKIYLFLVSLVAMATFTSCNDFLTRPPLTSFTDENFWTSASNVEAFIWGLYGQLPGFPGSMYSKGTSTQATDMIANAIHFESLNASNGPGWSGEYGYIRRCNLLLERVPEMTSLNEADANHFLGIAYFFRAWKYYTLISAFGGVPLVLNYGDPANPEDVYVPRASREETAAQIAADFEAAIANLKENPGTLQIGKDVAKALAARFYLFEGTFEKYHGVGNQSAAYLAKAAEHANALISSPKYAIQTAIVDEMDGWRQRYASYDLSANKEMIFYKKYEVGTILHSTQCYGLTNGIAGMSKYAADRFLCTDGLPINQSPLYQGDEVVADVIANRDARFTDSFFTEGYGCADLPLNLTSPNGAEKSITSTSGYVTKQLKNDAQPWNDVAITNSGGADGKTDYPIFTLAEQMLIYAEAKAELGQLTNADLDKSINVLRERAGVAPLKVQGTDAYSGTNGTTKVELSDYVKTLETATGYLPSTIIYEIRRERQNELFNMVEVNREDLMRWKKGGLMDTQNNPDMLRGAKVLATVNARITEVTAQPDSEDRTKTLQGLNKLLGLLDNGYVTPPAISPIVWLDKYYLSPIPYSDKSLYEAEGLNLGQNPGW